MSKSKSRTVRVQHIRRIQRTAFQKVMKHFNEIRSSLGSSAALDYSRITGGQGAQYNINDQFFKLIDFTVDVQNVVARTLDTHEQRFFKQNLLDQPIDYTIQSVEFMALQEKLGRVFLDVGLAPVRSYFATIRR
jgi:hypothetical protein